MVDIQVHIELLELEWVYSSLSTFIDSIKTDVNQQSFEFLEKSNQSVLFVKSPKHHLLNELSLF